MMIGLDIDGVLADFVTPFFSYVERKLGIDPIPAESITDLSFKAHPSLPEESLWKCVEEVSDDPVFWAALKPLIQPEDWRELDRLSRKRQLVFVTHRYERVACGMRHVTCEWLGVHGVSDPVVHFTQEYKSGLVRQLGIDLFMDDRHENCADIAEKTAATVLMPVRSYNRSFSHPRVTTVANFHELFEHISNGKPATGNGSGAT